MLAVISRSTHSFQKLGKRQCLIDLDPSETLFTRLVLTIVVTNMPKLSYNAYRDQMELYDTGSDSFETQFIVPSVMEDGDTLTPFQFKLRGTQFYFFGRYNGEKDLVEFVVAGPPGYKYKLSLADGNSPYGWKVKKRGTIRGRISVGMSDRFLGFWVERFMVMAGKEPSKDFARDIIEADAFATEEKTGLPMAIMRISHRNGIMNALAEKDSGSMGLWSFYGPSLPHAYFRCKLKLELYPTSMSRRMLHYMRGKGTVHSEGTDSEKSLVESEDSYAEDDWLS